MALNDRRAALRVCIFLFCMGVFTSCAHRYTTHQEPDCPPARAQTQFVDDGATSGVIAGTVLDRDSGRPIVRALIRVTPANQTTTSDSTGAFVVAGLSPGQHVVSTLRIGYERRTDTVRVHTGRSVRSQIALTPASVDRCMALIDVRTPLPWWHFW